jgi:argininosuccinate lyase
MKLWSKDATATSALVEQFTVGRDKEFDALLAPYDVEGSMAHVAMLTEQGLMTPEENAQVQQALAVIKEEVSQPGFALPADVEDIHSYVELLLTQRIGEAGKKIHTGRSRNDQVAVDIKLYLRAELLQVKEEVTTLFQLLLELADRHKDKLLPGYTHLQIAMPSSAGLWLGAYAESLVDDMEMLAAAYAMANKNPLGSGAGYGSSFPLNRRSTTEKLGFNTLNWNSVYAQMSRGKTEKAVATGISYVAATLSKLAYDCCLYINQNFGFISFPAELTTGSSIMPHKKNPDVFELVRGRCARIQALPNELTLLTNNLMSGYNRDYQLTKEILFPALASLRECLDILAFSLPQVIVADDILADAKYAYLFTVEQINEMMKEGMRFRDAYQAVGRAVEDGSYDYRPASLDHTHIGSIGNLGLGEIAARFQHVYETITA